MLSGLPGPYRDESITNVGLRAINPPTTLSESFACEGFVPVFATTVGPAPDLSHALAIGGPTVCVEDALMANPNHQNTRKVKLAICAGVLRLGVKTCISI